MKNANKHWYLVAHRSGARIFEQDGVMPGVRLVHSFDNPEGSLKDSDLVSDRQGRSDHSGASGHTAVGSDYKPSEHVLEIFVHGIGASLEQEAQHNAFDTLVLVAEPHVLGELRKVIGKLTSSRLRDSLNKDLVHVSNHDMGEHLKGVLFVREEIGK